MIGAPVGVGLVGYGMSGSSLHAPLIGAEPALRLRAVVSSDAARVHRDLPDVPVVPSLDAMLGDDGVELVVVAAPNQAHHALAGAALRADRHVVVDKPFTVTAAEADELVALAAERGRALAVFHQRRWDGDFVTVRRCVEAGALGRVAVYAAQYDRFRPAPTLRWTEHAVPGAGVLYDLVSHLVDQALCLFGPPVDVSADVRAQRPGAVVDDYAHLVLGYGSLRVLLRAGSLVSDPGPRFTVHGDAGSLVTHGVDGQIAAILGGARPGDPGWGAPVPDRYATLTGSVAGLRSTGRVDGAPGAYETFYRAVAAAVRGAGPVPVTGEEGRATVRVLEAAVESSRTGRVVPLGS